MQSKPHGFARWRHWDVAAFYVGSTHLLLLLAALIASPIILLLAACLMGDCI